MFRGARAGQDCVWGNQDAKLIAKTSFPKCFERPVDTSKVNLNLMGRWVAEKLKELLGFEDEIVVNLVVTRLAEPSPDPKQMQHELTGFLADQARPFMKELWALLLSAQSNTTGIPALFLEQKKAELRAKRDVTENHGKQGH